MNENIYESILKEWVLENKVDVNVISELRKQAFSLEKEGKNADAKKIFNFISFNNQRISLAEINDEKKDIKFDSLKILRLYSNVYDYEDYKPPFPSEELDNFLNILMNAKKYPRSINIFISGRPGTGKSTFVKFLSSQLNKPILSLRASNLISSYLGDTQRNIDFLFEDILNVGDNGIILIDELDSILGSRNNEINDEYKRMIGSFNMLFDDIPRGTIIIGITNNPSSIDKAILRRFNIKLELDLIDLEDFISLFSSKSREFDLEFNAKLAKKIISELTPDNENPESLITYSWINEIIDERVFFKRNLYKNLAFRVDEKLKEKNDTDMANYLYAKNFNVADISKILDLDNRTIKKKVDDLNEFIQTKNVK